MPPPGPEGARICLFGGTFDPIHSAHVRVAEEARQVARLDKVLFIPAGHPPHKPANGIAPYEDRLRMVQLACEPYPGFVASRLEEGEGPSYTIDTVRRVRKGLAPADKLFFLIGADAFDEIETWHDWQELVRSVEFIVVTRPGGSYKVPKGACVTALNGLELAISSSSIRARIAQGEPTPELPARVREYIDEKGLYR